MSTQQAIDYHSITIGDKNTWDDWHLVPTSRPLVVPPEVKTHFINIPGGDGFLDVTESLTGRPIYGNRKGSWEFLVMNDYEEWEILYSDIMAYLHGKELMAILDDDPAYYYKGRFNVNAWKSEKNWSKITIDYNVGPYKKSLIATDEDWLWDPFNFETGVIQYYKNIEIISSKTITFINNEMTDVTPTFLCTAAMVLTFDGSDYDLPKGTSTNHAITIPHGEHELTFTGDGFVTIRSEGGRF